MCGDLYRPCRSVTDDGIPGPAAIGHTHTHKGTACFLMHVLRRRASWRLFAVVFFLATVSMRPFARNLAVIPSPAYPCGLASDFSRKGA